MITQNNTLIPENAIEADLLQAAAASRLPSLSIGHWGEPKRSVWAHTVDACYNPDHPWRGGMAVYDTGIPEPPREMLPGWQIDPTIGQQLYTTWRVCVDEDAHRIYLHLTLGLVDEDPEPLVGASISGDDWVRCTSINILLDDPVEA